MASVPPPPKLSPNLELDFEKIAISHKNSAFCYQLLATVTAIASIAFMIIAIIGAASFMNGAFLVAASAIPFITCWWVWEAGSDQLDQTKFFTKAHTKLEELKNGWGEAQITPFFTDHNIHIPDDEITRNLLLEKHPGEPLKTFLPLIAYYQTLETERTPHEEGYGIAQVIRCRNLLLSALILQNLTLPTGNFQNLESNEILQIEQSGELIFDKIEGQDRLGYFYHKELNKAPLTIEEINNHSPEELRPILFPEPEEQITEEVQHEQTVS